MTGSFIVEFAELLDDMTTETAAATEVSASDH